MSIKNIVRVLADIRTELGKEHDVKLTIAMENAELAVLAQLHEKDYTLLDSGDGIADMHALANQDILLLGESSWGVMVHLVAPPGLTISETVYQHKYDNTTGFGRRVVGMDEYAAEILREGWVG
ncbi:hypothetical protein B0H17DRAFT_1080379 [Mycena rosella]|uniref:Uncharacterized protein n=1 Tax=Mycena rosella TaxID=1033263 RepID=A0AAD7D3E6_MYCRO|nr:hypothetical protein B0H17DRAFT_1080379 [Mycena rosella]